MARFDAVGAVTRTVADLLDSAARAGGEPFDADPAFAAALATAPPQGRASISVWLHRVTPSTSRRRVPAPPTEPAHFPGTAFDLHYLFVARASDVVAAQRALGWAIRVLEDHPSLPSASLNNGGFAGCFRDDEAVELTLEPLTGQEENDIWQVAQAARQPAAAYIARMVVLDSERTLPDAADVIERDFEVRTR